MNPPRPLGISDRVLPDLVEKRCHDSSARPQIRKVLRADLNTRSVYSATHVAYVGFTADASAKIPSRSCKERAL